MVYEETFVPLRCLRYCPYTIFMHMKVLNGRRDGLVASFCCMHKHKVVNVNFPISISIWPIDAIKTAEVGVKDFF